MSEIKFGIDTSLAPISFKLNGEFSGFDCDIADRLGRELRANVVFTDRAFNELVPALNAGQVDVLIAFLDVTQERKAFMDFTLPYAPDSSGRLVGRKGGPAPTLSELAGRKIAVQAGTAFARFAKKVAATQDAVRHYPFATDVLLPLIQGEVDVAIADDRFVTGGLVKAAGNRIVVGEIVTDSECFGPKALAVRKGNDALREKLNTALEKIKSSGTLDLIAQKHFGASL